MPRPPESAELRIAATFPKIRSRVYGATVRPRDGAQRGDVAHVQRGQQRVEVPENVEIFFAFLPDADARGPQAGHV